MVRYHGTQSAAIIVVGLLLTASALGQMPGAAPPSAPLGDAPQPALPDTVDAYSMVFDAWRAKRNPDTAILVVRHNGKTVFSKGAGADPKKPTLIASLSKAITGACIATLIRDGKLSFQTPMREALSGFFKQHRRPADRRFESVTVEQLLMHRSGLAGNKDGDPIHAILRRRLADGLAHVAAPQPLLAKHLKTKLVREPGSAESYSNTGYVALTAIIEERTGKTYESYCRQAIFDKLGIEARLHPDWAMFSGTGGWFIAGADYLKFLDLFDMSNPFLGDEVKAWMDHVRTRWELDEYLTWYSLGVSTGDQSGNRSVSHTGLLNLRGKDAKGRPIAAIVSSAGVRNYDGIGTFIAITPTENASDAIRELRGQLGRAHQAIRVWP